MWSDVTYVATIFVLVIFIKHPSPDLDTWLVSLVHFFGGFHTFQDYLYLWDMRCSCIQCFVISSAISMTNESLRKCDHLHFKTLAQVLSYFFVNKFRVSIIFE